jgi:hypothetical protein
VADERLGYVANLSFDAFKKILSMAFGEFRLPLHWVFEQGLRLHV